MGDGDGRRVRPQEAIGESSALARGGRPCRERIGIGPEREELTGLGDQGMRVVASGPDPIGTAAGGVTPQVVLERSGCEWYAAHEPGRMFVSDRGEQIAPLAS